MAEAFQLKSFDEVHMTADSKRYKRLTWISVPIRQTGRGITRLKKLPDFATIYGVYILMCEYTARLDEKFRGQMVSEKGDALSPEDIALYRCVQTHEVERTLFVLSSDEHKICWIKNDAQPQVHITSQPNRIPEPEPEPVTVTPTQTNTVTEYEALTPPLRLAALDPSPAPLTDSGNSCAAPVSVSVSEKKLPRGMEEIRGAAARDLGRAISKMGLLRSQSELQRRTNGAVLEAMLTHYVVGKGVDPQAIEEVAAEKMRSHNIRNPMAAFTADCERRWGIWPTNAAAASGAPQKPQDRKVSSQAG